MSELSHYYENFRTGYWAHPEPNQCRCGGRGWVLSEVDTWHKCPYHGKNATHPEYPEETETVAVEEPNPNVIRLGDYKPTATTHPPLPPSTDEGTDEDIPF